MEIGLIRNQNLIFWPLANEGRLIFGRNYIKGRQRFAKT